MKKMKRWLALVLTLCLILTLVPTTALAAETVSGEGKGAAEVIAGDGVTATRTEAPAESKLRQNTSQELLMDSRDDSEMVRVIVVLEGEALLEQGFTKNEIAAYGTQVAAAAAGLRAERATVLERVESAVLNSVAAAASLADDGEVPAEQEPFTVLYQYDTLINGFSAEVPYGAIDDIQSVNGVACAFEAPVYSVPKDMGSTELYTVSTQDSFGSSSVWNSEAYGYTGAGMRVAVIDTGLDLTHPSFAADPELTDDSLTLSEVSEALNALNAYNIYRKKTSINPTADKFYRSAKVPFAFNYCDGTLDVSHKNDAQGPHGTHVAGIVAANKTEGTPVVGVAPDAQLLIMKVFGQNGAPLDGIVAAIEDSVRLGVDAINMSLGSPAGFATDEYHLYDKVMQTAEEAGVVLAISAGNSYSAAYGNGLGTNLNLASDPDIGTVSSPSTLIGGTSVASSENATIVANYFTVGDMEIPYSDNAVRAFTALAGQTLDYVVIPGGGTEEAFAALAETAGADFVSGKVALIQRGEIAFTDKQANAHAYGAVAAVIYNNMPNSDANGGMLSMVDSGLLPNVGISLEDGQRMLDAAEEKENGLSVGTLTVAGAGDTTVAASPLAGTMSSFSSWGVTPDLQLMPDVTAPGGNIYSTLDQGTYGMMSGTSMSAPHIAGLSALVLQFLREEHPELTGRDLHDVAEAIIMSTAEPILESEGVAYSPRRQGAGLANAYRAVSSDAYLTVRQDNGEITPKVSLGDNGAGVYAFSFELHNIGDTAKTYMLTGELSTDQVEIIGGTKYMGETARPLSGTVSFTTTEDGTAAYDANEDGVFDLADVQYLLDGVNELFTLKDETRKTFDLNVDGTLNTADVQILYEILLQQGGSGVDAMAASGETVTVAPGETVTVQAMVVLSAEDKRYIETNYENGCYVDGFVRCMALDGTEVDLTLPMMGFYGDWSAAPVFDTAFWYDTDDVLYNRYWNVVFASYGSGAAGLGINPYLTADAAAEQRDPYDPTHNVLSPDGDGYMDGVWDIYLSMMRGAKQVKISWLDTAGNVLYEEEELEYVRKSYLNESYGICIPAQVVYEYLGHDLWNLAGLKNNDQIVLQIEAWLDDGDGAVDQTLTFPITIDLEAPELTDVSTAVDENGRRTVTLTAKDNHAVAAVVAVTQAGDPIEYFYGPDLDENGQITIDVTDYDSRFQIAVCDYAVHEVYYDIEFAGISSVREGAFYAYRRYATVESNNYYYPTNAYNGWVSFETPENMLDHTSQYFNGEASLDAAEYIDGYVIAVDVDSNIIACRPGEWDRIGLGKLEINGTAYPALDMAFDYANKALYVLTDNLTDGGTAYLAKVNYLTGEVESAVEVTGIAAAPLWFQYNQALTLACDNAGTLYTVDLYNGYLYTLDAATGVAVKVGETGRIPQYNQSMTVDHDTNELYWAYYQGSYNQTAQLFLVDKTSGACTSVGKLEMNSELSGLFKPYDTEETAGLIPDSGVTVTGLLLSESALSMSAGSSHQLRVSLLPYYASAEDGGVIWSSTDETVATVENGRVTAVGAGTAVITAAYGAYSDTCQVTVKALDETLYVYDTYGKKDWLTMDAADPASAEVVSGADTYNTGISAAAYLNGGVYAYDFEGSFYKLDPDTLTGRRLGQVSGAQICAMAYDYSSNTMYALEYRTDGYSSSTMLNSVNLANGAFEAVENLRLLALSGMALDYEGNFYVIGTDVYTMQGTSLMKFRVDTVTNQWGTFEELVYDEPITLPMGTGTGFGSLVYSDATNGLYWVDAAGELYWIDLTDYAQIDLGPVGAAGGSDFMGLFLNPGENEPEIEQVDPTDASLDRDAYNLMAGGSTQVSVAVEPWGATYDVTYETADPEVATVNAAGLLTGVAPGETTLTVTVTGLAPLTAAVTVTESAGDLYGFLLYDFEALEDFWVSVPTSNPGNSALLTEYEYPFSLQAGAYYDGYLYAIGKGGSEYQYEYRALRIDPMDFTCDVLPAEVGFNCRDMAFDYTTGTMYVTGDNGSAAGILAQMDLTTGELTVIGETEKILGTLAITDAGEIYGVSTTGGLYQVDREDLSLNYIASAPSASALQSMHYDLNSGKLFWAYASSYSSALYDVNMVTGERNDLGVVSSKGAELSCLYTLPDQEPAVPETVAPAGVSLTEKQYVVVGESKQMEALVLPVSVADVDQTLTWYSDDETVATVYGGVVYGVAPGTTTVTAVDSLGHSASCTISVLAEEREFWAYDDTNSAWIRFDLETGEVVETIEDANEDKIMASAYIDGTLYAYSDSGAFYTIDTENGFVRSEAMPGITGMTFYDYYEADMVDLSYDASTGKLYGLVVGWEADDWDFDGIIDGKWDSLWAIGEIDLSDGTFTVLHESWDYMPGNLLVEDGTAYYVDTLISGVINRCDLDSGRNTQLMLVYGYWGMRADGRSMIRDELTGDVYVIRGTGSEEDSITLSTLYTINLGTGAIRSVFNFGRVNINSLFVK